MRTCANKAHWLGGRGGFEPLPEAGEWVCDCYEHGTGEPWAHVGSSHVHERVVRCRECAHYHEDINGCDEFGDESRGEYAAVGPNGFCAWGEMRAQ